MTAGCEHGAASYDGTEPSMASAPETTAAISADQRGAVSPDRYRGRAGRPRPTQQAGHERLTRAGSLAIAALA